MFSASFFAAFVCLVISLADWRRGGALNAGPKARLARAEQLRRQDEADGMSLVLASDA